MGPLSRANRENALRAGQTIRLGQRDRTSIPQPVLPFNNHQYGINKMQLASWPCRVRMEAAPVPPLPVSYPGAGGQQPRPTPTSVRFELKGATAVNALQATLGELLLALAGLAVVLLAVILVLAEIDLILRLARRLTRRPGARPPGLAGGREVSGERVAERVPAE